jgi:predicted short-subunit dehydrogenase-like oxidoreductase (DUF2520 family)
MRELERTPNSSHSTEDLEPIAVIGRGRVGGAIARSAAAAGLDARPAGRDDLAAAVAEAATLLLCVPDAEIAPACEAAIAAGARPRFAGHTSGATGLDALAAARTVGASTFSLHPLQTVNSPDATLAGAAAAVTGSDPDSLACARTLAERLGLEPFELPDEARAAYHAAAAISSNFLVALEESAVALLDAAGVENGRELLAPLVLRTAANWAEHGGAALTGPIARGDTETVRRHAEALDATAPELAPLYEALAERTRELAAALESGRDPDGGTVSGR